LEILRLEGDPREGTKPEPEVFAAVFDVASLTVGVQGLEDLSLAEIEAVTVRFRGPGVATLYEAVQAAEEDLGFLSDPQTGVDEAPLRILGRRESGESELVLRLVNRPFASGRGDFDTSSIPHEVQRYLEGGFHLNLEHPRLAELLDRCRFVTGEGVSVLCLERLVHRYITDKSLAYGFAGLEDILEGREGDCTEHALLLVALLRSAGVPGRMTYGLILTEGGFIGHAWVELYRDGRWRWLDPSFPGGEPYGLKVRLGVVDPAEPVWTSLSLALLQVIGSVEAEILEAESR
jgi:transglutaminase-like putative cysteine protease